MSASKDFGNFITQNSNIENPYNPSDGGLPFALYLPASEGVMQWHCGKDAQNNITSVFLDTDTKKKQIQYLTSMAEANRFKNELEKAGWQKLKAPEIKLSYAGDKEERPMNRKERRALAKRLRGAQQHNPFEQK